MIEWFASFNSVEQMFLLSGIVGGLILILRLLLTIAGLDHRVAGRSQHHFDHLPNARRIVDGEDVGHYLDSLN